MNWFSKMADKLDKKIKEQGQDDVEEIVFKAHSPAEELAYSTPDVEEEPEAPAAQPQDSTINSKANNLRLRVTRPRSFDDSGAIADLLLEGCTVFLNTDLLKPEERLRMLDFLNGITYTTYGYIKNVSPEAYIITPSDVDISEDCFWEQ